MYFAKMEAKKAGTYSTKFVFNPCLDVWIRLRSFVLVAASPLEFLRCLPRALTIFEMACPLGQAISKMVTARGKQRKHSKGGAATKAKLRKSLAGVNTLKQKYTAKTRKYKAKYHEAFLSSFDFVTIHNFVLVLPLLVCFITSVIVSLCPGVACRFFIFLQPDFLSFLVIGG